MCVRNGMNEEIEGFFSSVSIIHWVKLKVVRVFEAFIRIQSKEKVFRYCKICLVAFSSIFHFRNFCLVKNIE